SWRCSAGRSIRSSCSRPAASAGAGGAPRICRRSASSSCCSISCRSPTSFRSRIISDMHLLLIGISHRTAPVELRERLDFQARGVADALRALADRGAAREAVVVSTCNRAELYVACDEAAAARQDLVRFVGDFHGVAAGELAPHVYDVTDLEVARHLFRVAAGL